MCRHGLPLVVLAVLMSLLTGCGGTAQMVAGGSLIAVGVGMGTYAVTITPDHCAESHGVEANAQGGCAYAKDEHAGNPSLGIPLLITSAALVVTGGILMLTAHRHHGSGTIH